LAAHGHRDGRASKARRDKGSPWCAPSGTACRGQSAPASARCERRSANPPAATLLTGQAVRELAPARTRLCLVCSLFGGAPCRSLHGRASSLGERPRPPATMRLRLFGATWPTASHPLGRRTSVRGPTTIDHHRRGFEKEPGVAAVCRGREHFVYVWKRSRLTVWLD
jgi:hypothetical protein